jgi:hypothetical protein
MRIRPWNTQIRVLLGLLLAFSLVQPIFSQAQPKPSPTPQATQPATHGTCAADYYRNADGVCVHRPVRAQGSAVPAGATAQCRDRS